LLAPKGRPKVTDFDWLVGQLRKVLSWGDRVGALQPEIHHDYGIHTALKLAALNHALDVFTPIARKQADRSREYGRSVYVDLFAGCGVTKTPKGDWLAGSPIIAAHSKAPFDAIVLVEKGSDRIDALKERIRTIAPTNNPTPDYILGDCNALRSRVLGLLRPNDLVFVAVDPEGMEIHWSTIREIVAACAASDLFINFTAGVSRVVGEAEAHGSSSGTLEAFTGKKLAEILEATGKGSAVLEIYEKGLDNEIGKPLGRAPLVSTEAGQPRYHLLIRTRRTRRGSPYWAGYEALDRRLSGVTATEAAQAIDIIKGRQGTLGEP
jgi:three-Cys-motif partner protein